MNRASSGGSRRWANSLSSSSANHARISSTDRARAILSRFCSNGGRSRTGRGDVRTGPCAHWSHHPRVCDADHPTGLVLSDLAAPYVSYRPRGRATVTGAAQVAGHSTVSTDDHEPRR